MRNPWADAYEHYQRSQACARGGHDDCSHLCGHGGGLNPRRLRLEVGAVLCKCECHSLCPITGSRMAVPFRMWRDSCSCAGAEQERRRHAEAGVEFPDFDEYMAQARQGSQLRKEAFDAARAGAAGKSRDEIRDLYEAELRSRGQEIPPEEILNAQVDAITGDYRSIVRLMGRAVSDAAKSARGIFRHPF